MSQRKVGPGEPGQGQGHALDEADLAGGAVAHGRSGWQVLGHMLTHLCRLLRKLLAATRDPFSPITLSSGERPCQKHPHPVGAYTFFFF